MTRAREVVRAPKILSGRRGSVGLCMRGVNWFRDERKREGKWCVALWLVGCLIVGIEDIFETNGVILLELGSSVFSSGNVILNFDVNNKLIFQSDIKTSHV